MEQARANPVLCDVMDSGHGGPSSDRGGDGRGNLFAGGDEVMPVTHPDDECFFGGCDDDGVYDQ
jgi:hypothetical protein